MAVMMDLDHLYHALLVYFADDTSKVRAVMEEVAKHIEAKYTASGAKEIFPEGQRLAAEVRKFT